MSYEIARFSHSLGSAKDGIAGPDEFTAIDLLAAARYWRESADVSLNITGAIDTLPSGFDQAPVAGVAVYRLNVLPGNRDDGGYTLQAQPVDAGPMRDDVCGSFVLDATGKRSNHAPGARAPPGTRCWLAH